MGVSPLTIILLIPATSNCAGLKVLVSKGCFNQEHNRSTDLGETATWAPRDSLPLHQLAAEIDPPPGSINPDYQGETVLLVHNGGKNCIWNTGVSGCLRILYPIKKG